MQEAWTATWSVVKKEREGIFYIYCRSLSLHNTTDFFLTLERRFVLTSVPFSTSKYSTDVHICTCANSIMPSASRRACHHALFQLFAMSGWITRSVLWVGVRPSPLHLLPGSLAFVCAKPMSSAQRTHHQDQLVPASFYGRWFAVNKKLSNTWCIKWPSLSPRHTWGEVS